MFLKQHIVIAVCFSIMGPTILCAQLDTRFIPDSAVGAIVMYPKDAASQESMTLFPHEIATAFGEQQFGVDPMKINEVILLVDQPDFESEPEWGGIIRMDEVTILGGEYFEHIDI